MREHEGNLIEDDRSGKGGDRLSQQRCQVVSKKNRDLDHPTDASGPTYAHQELRPTNWSLVGSNGKPL